MNAGDTTQPEPESSSPTVDAILDVLSSSVARLAALVEPLSPDQLRQQAYPTEWTVADVLSHLGSGAVISRLRIDGEVDMAAIWDEWNAKDPEAQARDALEADAALQERLAALTPSEQSALHFAMGPMDLDLATFLGMRLNEHALHTWDVAVTFDDAATIPADEAALVSGTLAMMARFAGKPTGTVRDLTVATVDPERRFSIALRPDGVSLSPAAAADEADLTMPTDALIRLVYGRLDPDHTPTLTGDEGDLEELRRAFPGF